MPKIILMARSVSPGHRVFNAVLLGFSTGGLLYGEEQVQRGTSADPESKWSLVCLHPERKHSLTNQLKLARKKKRAANTVACHLRVSGFRFVRMYAL